MVASEEFRRRSRGFFSSSASLAFFFSFFFGLEIGRVVSVRHFAAFLIREIRKADYFSSFRTSFRPVFLLSFPHDTELNRTGNASRDGPCRPLIGDYGGVGWIFVPPFFLLPSPRSFVSLGPPSVRIQKFFLFQPLRFFRESDAGFPPFFPLLFWSEADAA